MRASDHREVRGAGAGIVPVEVHSEVILDLTGLVSYDHEIHAGDLGPVREASGHEMDGCLGNDFLSRFAVCIQYRNRRMIVEDAQAFRYRGPGEVLPVEFEGRLPFIRGTIEVPGVPPEESRFLVDSGSEDEVDHPIIAKGVGHLRQTVAGVSLGEPTVAVFGAVDRLRLERFELRGLHGVASEGGLGSHLIGGRVLSRFTVIFDFPRSRLILESP